MSRYQYLFAVLILLVGCAEEDVVPPEIERKAAEMGDPLLRAVEDNQVEAAIEALQNGADPNVPKEGELPPLHVAASHGYVEVAEVLIKQKADVNRLSTHPVEGPDGQVKIRPGRTPLHLAVTGNHLKLARLLIEHDAEVNTKNGHDMTPLDLATSKGQFLERLENDEIEPDRLAAITKDIGVNQSIRDLLVEHGAKTSEEIEAAHLDQRLKEDGGGGILGQINADVQRIKNKRSKAEDSDIELDKSKTFSKEAMDKIGPFNLDKIDESLPEEPDGVDDFLRVFPDS
ncbi:MAG: ankyrin repeat domain-containing protein [Planctomycetota bacterium]|nr:ankyrin repeat domain-containing protein [Planctomycetota bacterium]